MRVVAEYPDKICKVTIYSWNNKYLVKLEKDGLEQTFKVNELDLTGDDDIKNLIENELFMEKAVERFKEMRESLFEALSTI